MVILVLTHEDVVGVEAVVVLLVFVPFMLHVEGHNTSNGLLGGLEVGVAAC